MNQSAYIDGSANYTVSVNNKEVVSINPSGNLIIIDKEYYDLVESEDSYILTRKQ